MTSTTIQPDPRPPSSPGSRAGKGIVDAFSGSIPRFRFRFFYGIGLFIVACVMILLPLAYLALIALVGYGVYWHAITNTWMVATDQGSIHIRIYVALAYVAPFVIGPLLFLFMLKPLFARQAHEREPLTLDRSQEPLLYAVLERLCTAIGAPMPRDIEVDCQLNAAAGFRHGIGSMVGRHMSLVIGLPLAAGLSLDQFMGVLAHELGHFSQGFGMRVSYLVRRINGWFGRVVYERDVWDEWLAQSCRSADFRIGIFLYIARLGIWINRKVLFLLMFIGHCICCAFLRQMEYDADRVATDVVGAKSYAAALSELHVLELAESRAYREMAASWREKRLPDNLPILIGAMARGMNDVERGRIVEQAMTEGTGIVSTHPSLRRRVAAIGRRGSNGVFSFKAPATVLFANFTMIANAVTLTNYRRGYRLDVTANNLFPTDDLLRQHVQSNKEVTASLRYFVGCHHLYVPPIPDVDAISPPADPRASVARLKTLRGQFDAVALKYAAYFKTYADAQERLSNLHVAEALVRAGFKRLDKKSFGIARASEETIVAARAEVNVQVDQLLPKLSQMRDALKKRLVCALELACVPAVAARLRLDEPPETEIRRLLPILFRFDAVVPSLPLVSRELSAAAALIQNAPENADIDELYPRLLPMLKRIIRETRATLEGERFRFEGVEYPFDHASGRLSVGEYLATRVTADGNFVDVLMAANETLDKLVALYGRCLGRLVHIAERVERAVGLPMAGTSSNSDTVSVAQ